MQRQSVRVLPSYTSAFQDVWRRSHRDHVHADQIIILVVVLPPLLQAKCHRGSCNPSLSYSGVGQVWGLALG